MSVAAGAMQVEKILDDLIYRLANADATAEVRAALVDAKRLRSVTMRWAAIPPPPDARKEMLARVMELISSVNVPSGPPRSGSLPPVRLSSPPSVPMGVSRPPSGGRREERDTPVADAALPRDAMPERSTPSEREHQLRRTAAPPPLPGGFRARSDPGLGGNAQGSMRPDARLEESPPSAPRSGNSGLASSPPRSQGVPVTAGSTAQTRRPPPSGHGTKPPPPAADLADADLSEPIELENTPPSASQARKAGATQGSPAADVPATESNSRPLSLRPPGPPAPPPPRRERPTYPQPFARTQSALPAADSPRAPIRAVGNSRGDGLDGLSTSISSSKRRVVEEEKQRVDAAFRLSDPVFPRAPAALRTDSREVSEQIADGISLVRPDCTEWQPHPVATGASLKLLYHNIQTGAYTALVRLLPGCTFPPRKHVALEEMFLVSGSASMGKVEMLAGEYTRAEPNSAHPEIRSATGCTFIVSGSDKDEMLPEGGA